MIFFVLHNCEPLCVGLSHQISIKYIYVCDCNVTKCGKLQAVLILLQASVDVVIPQRLVFTVSSPEQVASYIISPLSI